MTLPELCIRRPVMTTLMMVALLIFGIIGYRSLPVSELPAVDFPTISVSASLPGASPETMAAAVATPLEGQFSTIAGLDSMTSTSAQGSTTITLQFASTATSTPPPRTCSRPFRPPSASCRRTCRHRPPSAR